MDNNDLLKYNEKQANQYALICMQLAAGICAVMWLLNIFGFFIVDQLSMNICMPVGISFFLLPLALKNWEKIPQNLMKYLIMTCFLIGLAALATVLSLQTILIWACPVILSCHFYSPRFTIYTFIASEILMLAAFYASIFLGVWDGNIMHSSIPLGGVGVRMAYIREKARMGDNILLRAFNFYYLPRAVIISFVAIVGVMLSRRTHRLLLRQNEIIHKTEQISAELSVGNRIQKSFLPSVDGFEGQKEFEIAAVMNPAKEVGGDFYDCFMVDDRHLAIVVADVSGKGIPAALFMVISKTLIKEHTRPGVGLGSVFTEVNRLLCESNGEELFLTAFEGVLDLDTGEFRYVNAGHEIPFVCRKQGCFEPHKLRPGFVLAGMDGITYKAGSVQLEDGDKLFQYTDGVTEATDLSNTLYGMERLEQALKGASSCSPDEILKIVKEDIDRFVGEAPQFDDITMLCLQYHKPVEQAL